MSASQRKKRDYYRETPLLSLMGGLDLTLALARAADFVIARAARRLRKTDHIRRTRGIPSGPLRPEPRLELTCELL